MLASSHYKLLFDAGPEGPLFLRNCQNMGVSLADVEAIALSHGHWDHMGALLDALDHITRHNQGHQVPCHVNPGMFLERGARLTTGQIAPFQKVPITGGTCGTWRAGGQQRRRRGYSLKTAST